jgi:hypothetical protein
MKRSLLLTLLLAVTTPSAHAATLYDNFNLTQWTVTRIGVGPVVHEANQRLVVALPTHARTAPGQDYFRAGYLSKCLLRGDFDIQVRYVLVRFPPRNGVRVGFDFDNAFSVERISFGPSEGFADGDFYLIDGGSIIYTPTEDRWGTLRAVRENGMISGYYFDTNAKTWQFIGSSPFTTADMPFRISIWSHDGAFAGRYTQVAFDDVVVNAGTLVGPACPFAD